MRKIRKALAVLAAVAMAAPVAAGEHGGQRAPATLVVLEGTVSALDEVKAEGGLAVVRARIETEDGSRDILLAPPSVLEEMGFPVATGDRIRVRVFAAGPGEDAAAHKILNLSRDRMVRLRTLRRDPVWDSDGVWQGSRARHHGQGGGHGGRGRERHGQGGRGGG